MQFDRQKVIALDLETTGDDPDYALQPWRVSQGLARIRALSVAWYDEDNRMQVKGELDPSAEQIGALLDYAAQTNRTVIAWNTPFDLAWLLAYELREKVESLRWWDGMLLWKHAMCEPEYDVKGEKRKQYSLEEAVKEYYPEHADFKKITDFHTTDPIELQKLLHRNKMDAALTLRLAEKFFNMLAPTQQRPAIIEAASLVPVAAANLRGMYCNADVLEMLDSKQSTLAQERLAELATYGATPEILASPSQLSKLLYEDWGLPVWKRTATGQPSTDGESLFELAPGDPRAQLVADYREALNLRTKFVGKIAESLAYNSDGYTHPLAKIFGTYSGRMTYSSKQGKGVNERQIGFALHQMKNDKAFRAAIEPPPDHDIVEFDAANQEYRLMAIVSGDPVMMEMCQPGEDPHGFMGAQIGKCAYDWLKVAKEDATDPRHDEAKQFRKVGKFANLAFQYRVGVKKATVTARVKHGLDVNEGFVKRVSNTYLGSYRGVRKYWDSSIRRCRKQGYAETLAGRRVQLVGNWAGVKGWSMESTAINYPIQGTGAEMKYLAIACLKPVCTKYSAHFYFELHDGIYFVCPKQHTQQFIAEAKKVLSSLPYKRAWDFVPPVPLPWDCKVGSSWGNMKEVH